MTFELAISLTTATLIAACLAAVEVRALADFSRSELEEICRRRKSPERLGHILRQQEEVVLTAETVQVLCSAAAVGLAMWLGLRALGESRLAPSYAVALALAGVLVLLAANVWIPRAVAPLWAPQIVYACWPFWRAACYLASPLLAVAAFLHTMSGRLAGQSPERSEEESFGEEIRTIVTEGHREGLLEEDAREMIEGVIKLGEVRVSEIMTPRTDMVSLPLARTWDEVIEFAVNAEHTRIPVYNKTRDDIVGILFTKDLLAQLAREPAQRVQPWSKLLREPYFVPETKTVDVLLQEFQQTRQHMAVVLDEYGGVSGLVSMEDALEEIVGEIVDEYDDELVDGIRELGAGVVEARGRVRIDELNKRLGLQLPDEGDFDTIGGLVFSKLGHIPVVGEQLTYDKLHISVVESSSRSVERVRIEILDQPPAENS